MTGTLPRVSADKYKISALSMISLGILQITVKNSKRYAELDIKIQIFKVDFQRSNSPFHFKDQVVVT